MTSSKLDYYSQSYAHCLVHEDMISDKARTDSYKNAILGNPILFKNKVILDVGAGTGILSLFAVRAGAKKVYAIEISDVFLSTRKNYSSKWISR